MGFYLLFCIYCMATLQTSKNMKHEVLQYTGTPNDCNYTHTCIIHTITLVTGFSLLLIDSHLRHSIY